MNREALRCLIIDDHPVVRQGIRALLEREIDSVVVTDAATPAAALGATREDSPDVVIVDPRGAGLEVGSLVENLNRELGSAIVVFTSNGGARLPSESLKAGGEGYVRKGSPPEDLVRAIRAAQSGEFYVDPALSSTIVLEEGDRTLTARPRGVPPIVARRLQTQG